MIELRILSGSRAGQSESFDKSVIAVGRHPMSDLRFDASKDIDVSTRHGEIRGLDGTYTLIDNESTNGTFVNGQPVPRGGSRELRSGDVIGFGAQGPTVSVQIDPRTTPAGERVTEAVGMPPVPSSAARRPTTERVAIAVAEQTRGLKIAMIAGILALGGLAGGLYWMGHREAAASQARADAMASALEVSSKQLETRVSSSTNDTAFMRRLQVARDSILRSLRESKGDNAAVTQQAQRYQDATRAIGEMDTPAIVKANNSAIVLIRADISADSANEGTGFAVTPGGLVVTNRHVVEDGRTKASKVLVKFADSPLWRKAHIVRVPDDASVDLALLQIDESGRFPVVQGVASTVDAPVGGAIVSLGFPLGTELPMEGPLATATLAVGTVSKIVSHVLQIDSYASHGSSGSPVFDTHGHVIGVIYGGARGSDGRIVYAVPAPQIHQLISGPSGPR